VIERGTFLDEDGKPYENLPAESFQQKVRIRLNPRYVHLVQAIKELGSADFHSKLMRRFRWRRTRIIRIRG